MLAAAGDVLPLLIGELVANKQLPESMLAAAGDVLPLLIGELVANRVT
jgi:hypothetical protein